MFIYEYVSSQAFDTSRPRRRCLCMRAKPTTSTGGNAESRKARFVKYVMKSVQRQLMQAAI